MYLRICLGLVSTSSLKRGKLVKHRRFFVLVYYQFNELSSTQTFRQIVTFNCSNHNSHTNEILFIRSLSRCFLSYNKCQMFFFLPQKISILAKNFIKLLMWYTVKHCFSFILRLRLYVVLSQSQLIHNQCCSY